jgi:hypothetical protein
MLGVEADFAVAPVDDVPYPGQPCIRLFYQIHDLKNRSSGGDNVFYDENTLSGMDLESATQFHLAILPLCKNRSYLQHSAHFRANDHSSDGRGDHQFHVCVFKMLRDLTAEQMKIFGILKHPCTLEILRAVKAGRESEMPLEKGLCLTENVENLFFREFHGD